jgi:hypothetical protein
MNTNLKKCSIYLQVNDPNNDIDYDLDPKPDIVNTVDNQLILDYMIDLTTVTTLKIFITCRDDITSHILVKHIEIAGVKINDINKISFMQTKHGEIKRTNGYLDAVGTFKIKLHTNPISQNSLNYLLSLTSQK